MSATFATISNRMRLNFFSRNSTPEPEPQHQPPPQPQPQQQPPSAPPPGTLTPRPPTGKTFPADEVVWGIVIRNGFDELDDPWYHRGTTQHAYLEGNDNVSICGFRPPQSGPRTRRRSRLGLPTPGEHPMCGMCARMVVAPRPRVPVSVQTNRPPVTVPVARPAPVDAQAYAAAQPAVAQAAAAPAVATSPWVRQRAAVDERPSDTMSIEFGARHDAGLLQRGIHAEVTDD